ncbi:hypothetical protein V3390_09315 [Luteimonas sp. FXH3W]|uniref:Uncharacterized protein n=1 Tax=Aquilutibacter rugosus TaxID=3115820 RepID=A0ABU7V1K3_9GAMM
MIRDYLREVRIKALSWRITWLVKFRRFDAASAAFNLLRKEVASRSLNQIERMERKAGLRK